MMTPVGTLYWRAVKRMERRAARWSKGTECPCPSCKSRDLELLREAVRLANRLAMML